MPRGVVHGFGVMEAASILAIFTPGLFGSLYFREMADALNTAGEDRPDRALLMEIPKRHGLTPGAARQLSRRGLAGARAQVPGLGRTVG